MTEAQADRIIALLEQLVRQGDPAQRRILEEADEFVASLKGKTPAEMRALNKERNRRLSAAARFQSTPPCGGDKKA